MFRPWGLLDWALGLTGPRKWEFVGCLGPEERSCASPIEFHKRDLLERITLFRIEERNSQYSDVAKACLQTRTETLDTAGVNPAIIDVDLLASIATIEREFPQSTSSAVALDITSLPKRYFFYLLKRSFLSNHVRDLIITYVPPMEYPAGVLTIDPDPWDALPTFRNPDPDAEQIAHQRLIVNVGFIPAGLIAHLDSRAEEKQIDLIIPFPAPISAVERTWQSVWALRSTPYKARFNEYRVSAHNISEAFEVITGLLPSASNLVSFAPFGPKPISTAMCLYATLTNSPVYYAQPKAYRPDYSLGVSTIGNIPKVHTYWIKHEGRSLYRLPPQRQKAQDLAA